MKPLSVVLLLLPLSVCLAEVVDDFTESCPQFFATPNDVVSPPTRFIGDRFKQICQTLKDKAEFATFYDTTNRIPVYSAYRFHGRVACDRTDKWHIEPQLENVPERNMITESDAIKQRLRIVNQAVSADYSSPAFQRGHLAPVCHANSKPCADATFTLTNAAPQDGSFNKRWFNYAESNVAKVLNEDCITKGLRAYVVTGVVPGNNMLKGKVGIPSHFWTAFCCLDNNNKPKHSGAYYGEKDESVVYRWNVKNMETELTQLYRKHFRNIIPDFTFTLFAGECNKETEPKEKQRVENSGKRKKETEDSEPKKPRKLKRNLKK